MSVYPDTLIFDGTDLSTLTGITITDLSGVYAPGLRRGDHTTIPGRPGQLGDELPLASFTISLPIEVAGDTRAEMHANLVAAATALAGTNGLGLLERRLSKVGGGYEACTANGQFASFNTFSLLNPANGQTELTFVNLDGFWTRVSDSSIAPI